MGVPLLLGSTHVLGGPLWTLPVLGTVLVWGVERILPLAERSSLSLIQSRDVIECAWLGCHTRWFRMICVLWELSGQWRKDINKYLKGKWCVGQRVEQSRNASEILLGIG